MVDDPRVRGSRPDSIRGRGQGLMRQLKIRGRVLLVVAFAALLTGLVGGIGCWQIGRVSDQGSAIYTQALLPMQDLGALRDAVGRARMDGLSRVMAAGNQAAVDGYSSALAADEKAIDAMHASYSARRLTPAQRQTLETFWTAWTDYRDARSTGDQLAAQHRMAEFQQLRDQRMTPDTKQALNALNELSRLSAAVAQRERDLAGTAARTAFALVVVVAGLGLVAAAAIGLAVAASVVRPMHRLRDVLVAVGAGDLTRPVQASGRDEVGEMARALSSAVDRVRGVLATASDGCLALGPRAQQLHEASANLARTAEHASHDVAAIEAAAAAVTSGIQSVAGGATEMGASIQEIAANAQQAATVAGEAVTAAASADQFMSNLGSSSSEIGNVINLINSIAEQTNLLALNATIEAARAGAAGKGFAVVASEVKELAQETATATKDISGRVEAIQMDTSQAAQSISGVTAVIDQIDALQTAIASAVEEQSVTTTTMATSLERAADDAARIGSGIDSVVAGVRTTQADAESVERAAAEVTTVSAQLAEAISGFRL